MAIFNSYVKLPEGNLYRSTSPQCFPVAPGTAGTGFSAGFRTLPKTLARIKFTAQATSDLRDYPLVMSK